MKARFHLPGFTYNSRVNYLFIDMLEKLPGYFYDDVEIASVYDAFSPALWNGGRLRGGNYSIDYIKSVIKSFNDKGIPLRFTFTNVLLKEADLKDEFCNRIMKIADNGLNEIIVASPLLEDYIRTNYPNYKITSSTCKRLNDVERAAEELNKDYHIVVLDYDLNNKFDLLEKLPHKDKCEILVNACCNPGCKVRSEHYELISARQMAFVDFMKKTKPGSKAEFDFRKYPQYSQYFDSPAAKCTCEMRTLFQIKQLSTHVTPEAIREKYMPMGFNQFKIEGRTLELLNMVEHYMYYMAKPECRDEARYLFLCQLAKMKIINLPF